MGNTTFGNHASGGCVSSVTVSSNHASPHVKPSEDPSHAERLSARQIPLRMRKYMDNAALFRCPVCAAASAKAIEEPADGSHDGRDSQGIAEAIERMDLHPRGSALVCEAGHTFDVSHKGYVNFVPAQKPLKGYSKAFFEARREFLSWGYYDHVLQAVSQVVLKAAADARANDRFRVLDAGCAEGYYLRGIRQAIQSTDAKVDKAQANAAQATSGTGPIAPTETLLIGADISKDAVRLAAGGGDPNLWIVDDVANLALADASMDCILNVFTPANYREFRRVLRHGGMLVKVVPGPRHLEQLRRALGDADHDEGDVMRIFQRNCDTTAVIPATRTFDVPPERVPTLIGMTPLAFRLDEAQRRKIMVSRITIDARVLVGVLRPDETPDTIAQPTNQSKVNNR
ncbi:putative RNA methyltransferase [Pseudoscardovia suis]|uniref:putative RNA methyltransferase n=1 Tax=Pseudoscardovia suis TaxID=987063 RepID=UPI003F9BE109